MRGLRRGGHLGGRWRGSLGRGGHLGGEAGRGEGVDGRSGGGVGSGGREVERDDARGGGAEAAGLGHRAVFGG